MVVGIDRCRSAPPGGPRPKNEHSPGQYPGAGLQNSFGLSAGGPRYAGLALRYLRRPSPIAAHISARPSGATAGKGTDGGGAAADLVATDHSSNPPSDVL